MVSDTRVVWKVGLRVGLNWCVHKERICIEMKYRHLLWIRDEAAGWRRVGILIYRAIIQTGRLVRGSRKVAIGPRIHR